MTYLAVLDGRGESVAQQFEIADQAEILLVLLDHNEIDNKTDPSNDRLKAHNYFGVQLRDYLIDHANNRRLFAARGRRVHILLNKKDLWSKASAEEQQDLRKVFAAEVQAWKTALGAEVTSAEHSNASAEDIANLVIALKDHWNCLREAKQ
jgi:hypothetical protein